MLLKKDIHWSDTQPNIRPAIEMDGTPFIIMGKQQVSCHHAGKYRQFQPKKDSRISALNVSNHCYEFCNSHFTHVLKCSLSDGQ